ncbi:MAG: DUF1585 domain-containing protein, partial [Lentisphaeraceae bacterium]|nr:DUF1585 domain-containing protein [Lentisphaeraceae bacterium]
QKSHFIRSLTEALMGYAYGRNIGFADELAIDKLVAQTKAKGNRLGNLIIDIVMSPEFKQK